MKTTKILKPNVLNLIKKLKKQGKKIVFTNGCFDILHPGHVFYLNKAKSLGDILIVAINSDKSLKKLKGKNRPIMYWKDRAKMVENLESVDFVINMQEDTPKELLKKIRPHIHVKGGDYNIKDLPEYPIVKKYGGKVKIVKFLDGYSTTKLISKIKNNL